jgi:stage II sporulation protein P
MFNLHPKVQIYMMMAASTFLLFIGLTVFAQTQGKVGYHEEGIASGIPGQWFVNALRSELPTKAKSTSFDSSVIAAYLLRYVTGVQMGDPATLLAEGLPHVGEQRAVLLHQALATNNEITPKDYVPEGSEPIEKPLPATPAPTPTIQPNGQNLVFIYHSHNRESYLPELRGVTNLDAAYDAKINVTLVGQHLAQDLRDQGIGTVVSTQDYRVSEQAFNYLYSYRYSLKSIHQAMAGNHQLAYFIDVHRDSQRRAHTTTIINGQSYAQIYFIIGYRNPHWKQNEQLANALHQQLEKQYPGLSRGVWGKSTGNAEYNQSVSPHSILIEIGGAENSLAECYRTADVLSKVIATYIWGENTKEG